MSCTEQVDTYSVQTLICLVFFCCHTSFFRREIFLYFFYSSAELFTVSPYFTTFSKVDFQHGFRSGGDTTVDFELLRFFKKGSCLKDFLFIFAKRLNVNNYIETRTLQKSLVLSPFCVKFIFLNTALFAASFIETPLHTKH